MAEALDSEILDPIVVNGMKMLVRRNELVGDILKRGDFEPAETALLRTLVTPGETLLDLGANVGYYTLLLSGLAKEGAVYAFEPDPGNFRLLTRNVELNDLHNVTLVRKAVSDFNGQARLYLAGYNQGDHRLFDSGDGRSSVCVDVVRLDDFLADRPGRIGFVKMDIQGCEARALAGMAGILDTHRPDILMEFWPAGIRMSGQDPQQTLERLAERGYGIHSLDGRPAQIPGILESLSTEEAWTNLLCTGRRP
jgi:FkbM family methyltransferase